MSDSVIGFIFYAVSYSAFIWSPKRDRPRVLATVVWAILMLVTLYIAEATGTSPAGEGMFFLLGTFAGQYFTYGRIGLSL